MLRLDSGLREHGEILHSVSHPMSHPRWIQNSHFHPIGSRGTQCRGVRHFCWIQPQELFEFRICVRGHNHRLNCRDFVWRGCLRHVHRRYSKGVLPAKNRYFLILSLNPRAIDSARERALAQREPVAGQRQRAGDEDTGQPAHGLREGRARANGRHVAGPAVRSERVAVAAGELVSRVARLAVQHAVAHHLHAYATPLTGHGAHLNVGLPSQEDSTAKGDARPAYLALPVHLRRCLHRQPQRARPPAARRVADLSGTRGV